MSNHSSAGNLKFPGDDRRLDLTDVFAFRSAGNPDKTVLIIGSNPTSHRRKHDHPRGGLAGRLREKVSWW